MTEGNFGHEGALPNSWTELNELMGGSGSLEEGFTDSFTDLNRALSEAGPGSVLRSLVVSQTDGIAVFHGDLQTPDYTRALLGTHYSKQEARRDIEQDTIVRTTRGNLIRQTAGLTAQYIIPREALELPIWLNDGAENAQVMYEQLGFLLEVADNQDETFATTNISVLPAQPAGRKAPFPNITLWYPNGLSGEGARGWTYVDSEAPELEVTSEGVGWLAKMWRQAQDAAMPLSVARHRIEAVREELGWVKSEASANSSSHCVQIDMPGRQRIRDSKHPEIAMHIGGDALGLLLSTVKRGGIAA